MERICERPWNRPDRFLSGCFRVLVAMDRVVGSHPRSPPPASGYGAKGLGGSFVDPHCHPVGSVTPIGHFAPAHHAIAIRSEFSRCRNPLLLTSLACIVAALCLRFSNLC